MSNSLQVKFKVDSFRQIPNPYIGLKEGMDTPATKPIMYVAICDVRNLPENFPMETNPREQNLNTAVSKMIKASVLSAANNFYLLNRGILLSAESVSYNAYSTELTINFTDFSVHGNVDGGHTYKVILENRDSLDENITQFVKLEIITGAELFFQDLAEARNKSTQVKDATMADLRAKFGLIKDTLKGEPYAKDISYHENQEGSITINDLLAIFNMFNINRYPASPTSNLSPTVSYSSNKTCLDYYLDDDKKFSDDNRINNPYVKMANIMPDILKLYDLLEMKIGVYYKQAVPNGKYGSVKGVSNPTKGCPTKFYKNNCPYSTPKGFLLPLLSSLRALVIEKDGKYQWVTDPFKALDEFGPQLAFSVIERSRNAGNNPNAVGKDTQLWLSLFSIVYIKRVTSIYAEGKPV